MLLILGKGIHRPVKKAYVQTNRKKEREEGKKKKITLCSNTFRRVAPWGLLSPDSMVPGSERATIIFLGEGYKAYPF